MIFIWTNNAELFKTFLMNSDLLKDLGFQHWNKYLLIVIVPREQDVHNFESCHKVLPKIMKVAYNNNIQVNKISIK